MGIYGSANRIDIAGISAKMSGIVQAWQNGRIQIVDPNIAAGEYNVWDNKVTGRTTTVLWEGTARIQPVRWPLLVSGKTEQSAYKSVRFQIPLDADIPDGMMVREGLRIRVTDGGMFPDLTRGLFVITSSVSSSFAWNRTIEAQMDTGVDRGD